MLQKIAHAIQPHGGICRPKCPRKLQPSLAAPAALSTSNARLTRSFSSFFFFLAPSAARITMLEMTISLSVSRISHFSARLQICSKSTVSRSANSFRVSYALRFSCKRQTCAPAASPPGSSPSSASSPSSSPCPTLGQLPAEAPSGPGSCPEAAPS